jgi:phosphatidylethanolamine-binding protein (PEBP) family uncharacterized protein
MRISSLAVVLALFGAPAFADFKLSFEWGDIPRCTTGNPNTVGNPVFKLEGVPAGTTSVQFKLKDRDVPGYDHGGSKRLGISGDGTVPTGVFKYKSPCPPNGVHTYEWTATARNGNQVIGQAVARRKYPE